jgi:alpha-tubulin suppressor-like RCC1 family protein
LGDGTTADRSTPMQIMATVAQVVASDRQTAILKTDGTLLVCGETLQDCYYSSGSSTPHATPNTLATQVASVYQTGYQTFFLKTDKTLWGVGNNNNNGQLGTGNDISQWTTPVNIMANVVSVSVSKDTTLAIKTDASLWACGRYSGNGKPVIINSQVSMAYTTPNSPGNTFFLKQDGSAWATGNNAYGSLCNGGTASVNTPVQIK